MAVSKGDSTRTRTSFPQPRRAQGVISARKRHAEPEAGHPLEPIAKRRIETAPQHAPAGGGGGGAAGGVERAMRRGKKVRFDPVVEEVSGGFSDVCVRGHGIIVLWIVRE